MNLTCFSLPGEIVLAYQKYILKKKFLAKMYVNKTLIMLTIIIIIINMNVFTLGIRIKEAHFPSIYISCPIFIIVYNM